MPIADLWDGDRKERHSPYGSHWYRAVACILLSGRVHAKNDSTTNMTDVNRVGKEANFNQHLTERVGKFLVAMGAVPRNRQGRYEAGPNLAAFWDHDVGRLPTITRQAVLHIVQRHAVTRPGSHDDPSRAPDRVPGAVLRLLPGPSAGPLPLPSLPPPGLPTLFLPFPPSPPLPPPSPSPLPPLEWFLDALRQIGGLEPSDLPVILSALDPMVNRTRAIDLEMAAKTMGRSLVLGGVWSVIRLRKDARGTGPGLDAGQDRRASMMEPNMPSSFEADYPTITRWIKEFGHIEIGK